MLQEIAVGQHHDAGRKSPARETHAQVRADARGLAGRDGDQGRFGL